MAFDDPAYRTTDEEFRDLQRGRTTNAQLTKKIVSNRRGKAGSVPRDGNRKERIERIKAKGKGTLLKKTGKRRRRRRIGKIRSKISGSLFKKGKGFVISVVIFSWVITVWLTIQLPFYAFSLLAFVIEDADIFDLFGFASAGLYILTGLVIMAIGWVSLLVASFQYYMGGVNCLGGKNAAGKWLLFAVAMAAYGPWPGNFGPWILLWMIYVAYHPE